MIQQETMDPAMMDEGVATTPTEKMDPKAVNLREGKGSDSCANCTYFEEPNGCMMVQGEILPTQLCDLYAPMDGAQNMQSTNPMSML